MHWFHYSLLMHLNAFTSLSRLYSTFQPTLSFGSTFFMIIFGLFSKLQYIYIDFCQTVFGLSINLWKFWSLTKTIFDCRGCERWIFVLEKNFLPERSWNLIPPTGLRSVSYANCTTTKKMKSLLELVQSWSNKISILISSRGLDVSGGGISFCPLLRLQNSFKILFMSMLCDYDIFLYLTTPKQNIT